MLKIVKSSPRSNLYYKEYSYAIQFYIRDASALRTLSHKNIENYIDRRYPDKRNHNRWGEPAPSQTELENLFNMCDRLLNTIEPYKKIVCHNYLYIYSNNLDDLNNITSAPYMTCKIATQADVCLPENVVLLKDPKRKFRTYLKERWIPEGQTPVLRKFLLNRTDSYDFTPLFKSRLETWDRFYTMGHFFIDHDDPRDLVMLDLVVPGLIRKTLPIVAK